MKNLKIITSCFLLIFLFFGNSVAQTTMIIGDLFEAYEDGTYPNANGWYNLFNGASAKVVTEKSFWGQKFFKLEGNSNWSRIDVIDVNYGSQIFYKVDIYIPNSSRGATIGFFQKQGSSGPSYNSIMFRNDGTIYTRGTNESDKFLQNYSANTWYRVRVAIDFSQNKMDVYINDQLKAQGIIPKAKSYCYSFGIGTNNFSGSGTGIAYFDNVSVLKTYIPSSSPKALMVTNYYLYDLLSLIEAGFNPTIGKQIPSNMSQYELVYVGLYGACNSTTAGYLKNYVQNGGGVILMGGGTIYIRHE